MFSWSCLKYWTISHTESFITQARFMCRYAFVCVLCVYMKIKPEVFNLYLCMCTYFPKYNVYLHMHGNFENASKTVV